jgi:hypothetical protein
MTGLKLFGLREHLYQKPFVVCAHIYYADLQGNKIDHKGNPIGDNFYNDSIELCEFLNKNILPKIQKELLKKHVPLYAKEVDFVNQEPHPFIAIQNNSLRDFTYIQKVLNSVILDINKNEQKKLKKNKESKLEHHDYPASTRSKKK